VSVLGDILATKRDEVTLLHRPGVREQLVRVALEQPPTRPFTAALRPESGGLGVVAELKRRSPSKGDLAPDLDPEATARAYEAGGAAALSVLTDGPFFGGRIADLEAARAATSLPALRKDFVIDAIQVYEARAVGADAVLLIAAAVTDDVLLRDLAQLAAELGLAALVEVHDAAELDRALECSATIVGVNARDLASFAEDLGVGERLAARIPPGCVAVAESAIRSRADAERMAAAGFDAVLVGEALVRAPDPTALVRELASVPRRGRG
jgi:indole-3-glycerol phosphate synthase